MEREEYITFEDATKEYGYSRMSLYRLAKDEKITLYRRPRQRHTLVKRSELERLKPTPKTNTQPGG